MAETTRDACEEFCFDADAVRFVKSRMLKDQETMRVAEIFKALGDSTRTRILHALSQRELCVCDLSLVLDMSPSAVSHQLRVLKGARLVKYRKKGKNVYYTMDDAHITLLFRQALEHVRHD